MKEKANNNGWWVQLEESSHANGGQLWENSAHPAAQQPHGDGLFYPLECQPTPQIGYQPDQMPGTSVSTYMPAWLEWYDHSLLQSYWSNFHKIKSSELLAVMLY